MADLELACIRMFAAAGDPGWHAGRLDDGRHPLRARGRPLVGQRRGPDEGARTQLPRRVGARRHRGG